MYNYEQWYVQEDAMVSQYDFMQCPCKTLCVFSDLAWYHQNLPYIMCLSLGVSAVPMGS